MLVKSVPSVATHPSSDLITDVTCILEVDTSKYSAITIVYHRLSDICDSSRDDLPDRSHVAAQLNVNVITTVPELDDGARSSSECRMRGQVVLMVWRWIKQRYPSRVGEVTTAS
jgi:hypothetical protein